MDDIDAANELAEQDRQGALAEHFRRRRTSIALGAADVRHTPGNGAGPGEGGKAEARHCSDCGHAIPAQRLAAQPYSTRCIGCQTKHERER
jgi:phage/conjugal plasmid C-4 type zinc finger TraR family protein